MIDLPAVRTPIPVTVIGGYLGAGKTTCLNHLLAGDHGLRLAVLVNDFGAINIDAGLIARHDGDTVALTNGCVCCSIADDLGSALNVQVARPDPPDQILIEASGVADPAKIARLAGNWPGCTLAQIIVLADAGTVRARAKDKFVGRLVMAQLQSADLVALNKTDLAADDEQQRVRAWIQSIAPDATLIETRQGVLPDTLLRATTGPVQPHEAGDSTGAHPLTSLTWSPEFAADPEQLQQILLSEKSIHRAKGIIETVDGLKMIQLSGDRVTIELATGPATGLVVIGPFNTNTGEALLDALAGCAAPALSAAVAHR